jgi:hypothetical protein
MCTEANIELKFKNSNNLICLEDSYSCWVIRILTEINNYTWMRTFPPKKRIIQTEKKPNHDEGIHADGIIPHNLI